jgi:purine-nucleoside phosphorylase
MGPLSGILTERNSLTNIIIGTIIASLGVNLISESLLEVFFLGPRIMLIIGIGASLASIWYFIRIMMAKRIQVRKYSGFFIVDYLDKKVIPVSRYPYSENLSRYLESACAESQDIKMVLERSIYVPDTTIKIPREKNIDEVRIEREERAAAKKLIATPDRRLILEATEYFILRTLSTHLTNYFSDEKFKQENLTKFEREDIPQVLLENRFLNLFSKPMEERTASFGDRYVSKSTRGGSGERATDFIHFHLILPTKAKVSRIDEKTFEITTQKFKLRVSILYLGTDELLPTDFEKYYLRLQEYYQRSNLSMVKEKAIEIEVKVFFKNSIFFSTTGLQYYEWLDSYLDKLEEEFSSSYFFKKIGWDSVSTLIDCLNRGEEHFNGVGSRTDAK